MLCTVLKLSVYSSLKIQNQVRRGMAYPGLLSHAREGRPRKNCVVGPCLGQSCCASPLWCKEDLGLSCLVLAL